MGTTPFKIGLLLILFFTTFPLTPAQTGGWYIKGTKTPWRGPASSLQPVSSNKSSLAALTGGQLAGSKTSLKGSDTPWRGPSSHQAAFATWQATLSHVQTSTSRSAIQKSTPKYKTLSLKEFELLKPASGKKTTTRTSGVRFSTPSTTFTTPNSQNPTSQLEVNRHQTAFSKTFVQAPPEHSNISNFVTRQKRSNPRWSLIKTEKLRKRKRKAAKKEKRGNEERKKREKEKRKVIERKVAEKEEGSPTIQRESISEYRAPVSLHHSELPFIRSIY